MKAITDTDFSAEVLKSVEPVLVDVWAEWCPPCKMLMPTVEKLANAYAGRVKIVKMDGEVAVGTVAEYKVGSLPTLLFFKGGKLVKTLTGLQKEAVIKETLDSLL